MLPWRGAATSVVFRFSLPFLVALVVTSGPTPAVSPVVWTQGSPADFEKGKPQGVAVTARGGIVLARPVREIPVKAMKESVQPFLWSCTVDSEGNLFVGSGNQGKVFRITKEGKGTLFFPSGDLAAQALAVDSRDNLYVGTSPNGRVYRVTPKGEFEVWFDPDDRYIWDLTVDRSGNLFVATGEHGIIYKVSGRGEGTPFFDSEEAHIVTLTTDPRGNLLAGSSGKGLLYRITPDGKGTVLLDPAYQEINAIAVDKRGQIFASALVPMAPHAPPRAARRPSPILSGGVEVIAVEADPAPDTGTSPGRIAEQIYPLLPDAARPARAGRGGSRVFRIDTDGVATPLWSSDDETVFSMAVAADQVVYLGTGDKGKIRRVEPDGTTSLVAKVGSSQVTALAAGPEGRLYAAASNAGRIFELDAGVAESGTYVSPPRDATTMAQWGRIGWYSHTPQGTKLELFTRSGNSAYPDGTWSDWSPPYAASENTGVVSPSARFIQWKARLSRQAQGVSPLLEAVHLTYLPANLPPTVRDVQVNPSGVVVVKPPILTDTEGPETAFTEPPDLPQGVELPSPYPVVPGKKVFRRGMRSLSWNGSDPNRDQLRYDLFFKEEGGKRWKPLARGLSQEYFAWDSRLLPDGRYRIRVVASDAPSNPAGKEKSGEDASPAFVVDNTPPRIETTPKPEKQGSTVELLVSDTTSAIRSLSYSVDAAPWVVIYPLDGIADSPVERYQLVLDQLSSGEHTVLFKATDTERNTGTGQVAVSSK